MYHFFETIKVQNSHPYNLQYHNRRLNNTLKKFFPDAKEIDLFKILNPPLDNNLYRCKIIYSDKIESINYYPYVMRKFNSFKMIQSSIKYQYKSTSREIIDQLVAKKEQCDDIIIHDKSIIKDTSIANIAIYDGLKWYTPTTPLLKGTYRSYLLENKLILEKYVKIEDIKNSTKLAIMNAMVGFYELKNIKIIY
jgi:4-amino-4-deoxychorismate lyase